MSLLIVGCGYLGTRLARRWQQTGQAVFVTTRSEERAEEFAAEGWLPIVADICDPASLQGLPAVDAVVFAVGYDRTAGRSQQEVYVDGFSHVLQVMSERCKRFVYISSSSVYGQHAGEWVDEDSPCVPSQPGGQYCLQAEQLLQAVSAASGFQGTVLRLSGIYGPGRLLSRIDALQHGEPLMGSPEAWLNLIHVEDAVSVCVEVLTRAATSAVYLVSDHEPVPRGDYYRHLAKLVGAPEPVFDPSQPARRGAGGLNKRCSNRRLVEEFALKFRYPTYREGLVDAIGAAQS
ncbi:NAD-dependent epimerase/dehydratase family protein [bacterium]|nr:NAD-dependent epimerase/dehydratase family protein [bacterium]